MPSTPVPLKNPALAALLAWLVPGLGHVYQGRMGKGVLYLVCILGLYTAGMILGRGEVVYWSWVDPRVDSERFRLPFLLQVGVGLPGLWAILQATLDALGHVTLGPWLAEPSPQAVNALHPALNKMLEMAYLYTMMAGLLNVFAIYDAYAGPAISSTDEPSPDPAASQVSSVAHNDAPPLGGSL